MFNLHIFASMCAYTYAYVSVRVSIYNCIFIFKYIPGFLSWYIIMWEKSLVGEQTFTHLRVIYLLIKLSLL